MIRLDLSEVQAWLNRLIETMTGEGELPARVHRLLCDDARRQFAQGGDPAWRPLAESTVAAKLRSGYPRLNRLGQAPASAMQNGRFGPANILMRTMALFGSWTNPDDPNNYFAAEDGVIWNGSTLPYAATHQYGRDPVGNFRASIPARPIRVSEQCQREVRDLISRGGK